MLDCFDDLTVIPVEADDDTRTFRPRGCQVECIGEAPGGSGWWCSLYRVPSKEEKGPVFDVFRKVEKVFVLHRYRPGDCGAAAREIPGEDAQRWLTAHPCARLRVRCLQAYRILNTLSRSRTVCRGGGGDVTVQNLWQAIRAVVHKGVGGAPPEKPAAVTTFEDARRAVDTALRWCEKAEAQLCPPDTDFGSDAAAQARAAITSAPAGSSAESGASAQSPRKRRTQKEWLPLVLAYLGHHPDALPSEVIQATGIPKSTYYSLPIVEDLQKLRQGQPGDLPRGHKRGGSIEAYS